MASVRFSKVEKYFKENQIIHNFNLEVKDGEFVVLVGPSGCGKSTTLRLLAGLEEISKGEIYINDRLINKIPPQDRNVAMVFQDYALYPHLKVYDNLAFSLKVRGFDKREIDVRVREAANILSIDNLLERKPQALSGGQRQRVAIGRALVRKPDIFLFDEPLSNLDAKLRVEMRREILRLHRRLKVTTLYVTHDQIEAMTMADRIVVMKDGFIMQIGTPQELYSKPQNKFVASFIGSPPMNFFCVRISSKNSNLCVDLDANTSLKIPEPSGTKLINYKGKTINMGVRPEDIHDSLLSLIDEDENGLLFLADIVEHVGKEKEMQLIRGDVKCISITQSQSRVTSGMEIKMLFDMKKAHFFDDNGVAIN